MRQPEYYSAVFAIIRNQEGHILFQKRANTGFRDGYYQLPSGHLEISETVKQAVTRELIEELNIFVQEDSIHIAHVAHTMAPDRVYFNIYVIIEAYEGLIENMEQEKCSEIVFMDYDSIKNNPLCAYEYETLERLFSGEYFSEKII